MKQIFLTSSINFVAQSIAKKLDCKDKKLAFIYTAAEAKEGGLLAPWNDADRQSLVEIGFQVEPYTITGKSKTELNSDLAPFDAIYMSGGDTYYLLQQSQKSGFISLIRSWVNNGQKTYLSTSAGSIIAGDIVPNYLFDNSIVKEIDDRHGYGLVNFTIMPHWGSKDFKNKYQSRLEIAYVPTQVPLIALTNNQYIHIQDDQMEIIDVTKEKI